MFLNLIWFGYIARLSQWGGWGNFQVQMISTCLRYTGHHPVRQTDLLSGRNTRTARIYGLYRPSGVIASRWIWTRFVDDQPHQYCTDNTHKIEDQDGFIIFLTFALLSTLAKRVNQKSKSKSFISLNRYDTYFITGYHNKIIQQW
jgi:hypothetical protein